MSLPKRAGARVWGEARRQDTELQGRTPGTLGFERADDKARAEGSETEDRKSKEKNQ